MKTGRHDAILEIIATDNIDTQEQLTEKLRERGFSVTQATVSRDIKQLRLVKRSTNGGSYKYTVQKSDDPQNNAKYRNIMRETLISIRQAGTLVVVRTYTGMANAAAAAIDAVAGSLVVGTIAGDDTIFVATESEETARIFIATVKNFTGVES
ncbi:MAG: arginine repressor [Clostridia bacterium]|nr:arginine repressor [Clostridia bacterium]